MEVLSPGKKHTQALEMVSEEEEEVEVADSEHEEGEICTEEEDEEGEGEVSLSSCLPVFHTSASSYNAIPSYQSHVAFPDRRGNKKFPSAPVTSEVVIYDDQGRTAIFTSPPKKKRLSSYPRRNEGSRQHTREAPRRKEKDGERSRRHHSSSAAVPEKWPKVTRRADSKGSGVSEEVHSHTHKGKEVRGSQRVRRSRQSSPESTSGTSGSSSSSPCSCSSSSSSISYSLSEEESDVTTVSPCKGRGKENRRCGPSSKGHDRSPPPAREYGCDRPPPKVASKVAAHRTKHSSSHHRPSSPHPREPRRRPSYYHNIRRSPKARVAAKTSHHRTHQKPSKPKPSERKEATKTEKPAKEVEPVGGTAKGQNWLPRGSLGEMLLGRPKVASTHSTPATQTAPQMPAEGPKAPAKVKEKAGEVMDSKPAPPAVEAARELHTLDQEDDEELQLRYIAIQSSLRLLTDMQKEGQQQEKAGEGASGLALTDEVGAEATRPQKEVELVPTLQKDVSHPGSYTPPLRAKQEVADMERTLGEVLTIQTSDDIISISSSSSLEICIENLATNNTYLEAAAAAGGGREGQQGEEEADETKGADEARRKARERPDVDQDPVDMEICDSSGEDEGGAGMVEVVRDSPLSPEPDQDVGQGTADPPAKGAGVVQGSEGVAGSNFQIPVEWAYMVPPPPPPDQPANDLQNISSWCYDQNMYLQSMQAAPAEQQHQDQQHHQPQDQPQQHQHHQQQQQQQQQHSQPDSGGGEWVPPQPLTAPWPPPFMDSYDNSHPSGVTDNSGAGAGVGLHHQHHSYAPPEVPQAEETGGEQSKDLRDIPAEHYQAFMSAVLQQQQQQSPKPKTTTTFTECPQRNLILVPLSGSHHSKAGAASTTSKKTKIQKQRAKKRRLKKQRAQENLQQVTTSNTQAAVAAAAATVEEEDEEDEDLLRAQLLIDMSRKKEQRINESQGLPPTTSAATTAVLPQPLPALASRVAAAGREGYEGRASPQVPLPSSESLSPVPRNLRMVKSFGTRPRSGENSPTHSFRADLRPGLSDIGGWGLDPKGSKFNYHGTQHDFPHGGSGDAPKVKFPPIKPIIISLMSDSEDSEEEDDASQSTSSLHSDRKESEAECLAGEPMSQSIDILLKSMRNANPAAKEHDPPPQPKPGPSTPSLAPPKRQREVADNTPQAVRHLSRHQQEEYRWLKEQLRKKMLQMQQKPLRAKPSKSLVPLPLSQSPLSRDAPRVPKGGASPGVGEDCTRSLSPTKELPGEVGSEAIASSGRAVTWKDVGLLQIQVSNEAALDVSTEIEDSCRGQQAQQSQAVEGYSSVDASATEDEDEETLRRMALLTQKKKTESSTPGSQRRRVVLEGSQAESNAVQSETTEGEDALTDTLEEHLDDSMKGEWMVLDEVREDGTDAGEELCIRGELSESEMDECGEGEETSDATESITRSPERPAAPETVEGRLDTLKEQQQQQPLSENSKLKISKSDAVTNNTSTDPCQTAPLNAEGRGSSVAQEETKDQSAVKTDAKQPEEASCDGEKIEEVIRRIESKTRVVREEDTKAGDEGLSESEMDECGEGEETSDATESVTRSPERPAAPDGMECRVDALKEWEQQLPRENSESKINKGDATTNSTSTDPCQAAPLSTEGRGSSVAQEETKDHLAVKTDAKQPAEASCDGEKIEEVIRRIESKTRVVREKTGSEGPALEPRKGSVPTQGSGKVNNTSPALAKKQVGVELAGKEESKVKTNQVDMKQTVAPYLVTKGAVSQLVKLSTGTSPSVDIHKATANIAEKKEGKTVSQRIVVMHDASLVAKRKVKVVRAAVADAQDEAAKEASPAGPGVTSVANGTMTAPQETEKSVKMQLQLKKVEKDYKTKKNVINKIIIQLSDLLKEVNEEQRQRQELKKNVEEMKAKLKHMEAQLERKSSAVQTKIEVIRQLQQQYGTERQAHTLLAHQGERIGKLVHGSGYSFPEAFPSSPNSKTKETHIKKSLASSISAIRQQMRDLAKRKNNQASGVTNGGVEARVVGTLTLETKKESAAGSEKPEKPLLQVSQGKVPSNPAVKPQGKATTVVKRKLVSSGVLGGAKVAKVDVPKENNAIQERRVSGVPLLPVKAKNDKIMEEKLDEMKVLCPHDLLGRCNDSACQYQHLPSARPSLPPTPKGSVPGTVPPAASTVKRAIGGKTGAGVKIVPAGGSDGKEGFIAPGRTVTKTKMVTQVVECEMGSEVPLTETCSAHQETKTPTATDPHTSATHHTDAHTDPDTLITHQAELHSLTTPHTNTHTPTTPHTDAHTDPDTLTIHQAELHSLTTHHTNTHTPTTHHTDAHTDPNTPTTHQAELHSPTTPHTNIHTPTTHQETTTPTSTETHTTQERETHTHQLTEAQDTEELVTAQHDIATPKEEETESLAKTHSDAKYSEVATEQPTEPQDIEIQTEISFTASQEGEIQETHAEETTGNTALQNQTFNVTLPDPQTHMTSLETETGKPGQAIAPTREEDTETQRLDTAGGEFKAPEDRLSSSVVATDMETEEVQADTHTDSREGDIKTQELLEEDELSSSIAATDDFSDTTPGTSKHPSRKTGSRVTRSHVVSKSNAEGTAPSDSQDMEQEGQDVENEEETSVDSQETRVTRRSSRVKAKTSPKSRASLDGTRTSLRKRKSDNGESPVKNSRRRTSSRL